MPSYGARSRQNLDEAHDDLQRLMDEVIKHWDCSILEGHRPQAEQDEAVRRGTSKVNWPDSKHNKKPSDAIDAVPYPIDWNNTKRMVMFGSFVLGVAAKMDIPIRWGGDWNRNQDPNDEDWFDLPHFELARP